MLELLFWQATIEVQNTVGYYSFEIVIMILTPSQLLRSSLNERQGLETGCFTVNILPRAETMSVLHLCSNTVVAQRPLLELQ